MVRICPTTQTIIVFPVFFAAFTIAASARGQEQVREQEQESAETPEAGAHRLALGEHGWIEPHGLLQVWFFGAFDDNEPYAHLGEARSSLRLRRAEIKLAGEIVPEVAFTLMIDPAKVLEFGSRDITVIDQQPPPADPSRPERVSVFQPVSKVSVLQDLVLTFRYLPYVHLSVGQTKTPISFEGLASSARLLFVERSEVGRLFGDQRDIGLWAHYRFRRFAYHLGIYNGAGANTLDADANKDAALRVEVFPLDGLTVGVSAQRTLAGDEGGSRTIAGGDIAFERGPFAAQAEFYWARAFSRDDPPKETRPMGTYVAVGYTLGHWGGDWQPAARFDWFDPDGGAEGDDYWRATGGVNLFLSGHNAKLQLNYTHTQARARQADGSLLSANDDLVLFNAQAAF